MRWYYNMFVFDSNLLNSVKHSNLALATKFLFLFLHDPGVDLRSAGRLVVVRAGGCERVSDSLAILQVVLLRLYLLSLRNLIGVCALIPLEKKERKRSNMSKYSGCSNYGSE